MRIDQLLVQRGLASTRSQAQRLIAAGVLWQHGDAWQRVAKNGDLVPEDAPLQLQDESEARYVSRGGLKLQGALAQTGLDVRGWHCLDVGQSTGGFTDFLLQHGAASVLGLDVGHGQLHPKLRADARVRCLEGVNARSLNASDLIAASPDIVWASALFDTQISSEDHGSASASASATASARVPAFDLIVLDLSFISQTLVLPAVVPLLKPHGWLLSLVKPQFELQPAQVGKGGIVKDATLYPVVEQRLRQCCTELNLRVTHWLDSPITGTDGNREFFIAAQAGHTL